MTLDSIQILQILSGNTFLKVFILCKLKKEDRHILEILSIQLSLLSQIIPRFLTEFVSEIICPPTITLGEYTEV